MIKRDLSFDPETVDVHSIDKVDQFLYWILIRNCNQERTTLPFLQSQDTSRPSADNFLNVLKGARYVGAGVCKNQLIARLILHSMKTSKNYYLQPVPNLEDSLLV